MVVNDCNPRKAFELYRALHSPELNLSFLCSQMPDPVVSGIRLAHGVMHLFNSGSHPTKSPDLWFWEQSRNAAGLD